MSGKYTLLELIKGPLFENATISGPFDSWPSNLARTFSAVSRIDSVIGSSVCQPPEKRGRFLPTPVKRGYQKNTAPLHEEHFRSIRVSSHPDDNVPLQQKLTNHVSPPVSPLQSSAIAMPPQMVPKHTGILKGVFQCLKTIPRAILKNPDRHLLSNPQNSPPQISGVRETPYRRC